jgi:hypothetical protein
MPRGYFQKIICSSHSENHGKHSQNQFQHLQYGVGTSCGTEKIVHNIRVGMELNPQYDMVSIDFKNALNVLIRNHEIQTCVDELPVSANYLKTFYIPKNDLYYSDNDTLAVEVYKSEDGCQQGCGLGTFLYSAGTFPFLKRLASLTSYGFIKGFVDN